MFFWKGITGMFKTLLAATTVFVIGTTGALADTDNYVQTNLSSDLPGVAAHQDPNLVNPWGLVASATSPFWVSDNGTGLSTLYNGTGTAQALVVTVPTGAPTGIVFNSTASFAGSHFIFDTENGTLAAWTSGTSAMVEATSPTGSVYKGLAIGAGASGNLLYAANFGLGSVDVFDANFHPTTVAGGFHDASIPAGYAPFNIQAIGGDLYVTYALQDAAKHDDVAGMGHGYVDEFDMNGNLIRRFTGQGALNSPWGLALAPSQFGALAGDLLIGNFGDGTINAYDPVSGNFLTTLDGTSGNPLVIAGLWGLRFGNGAPGQDANTLYFTAGIPGPDAIEDHGLFGSLAVPTPEPQATFLVGMGLGMFLFGATRRRSKGSL
jgi:uncharacterized protein (TIGR03118 family)